MGGGLASSPEFRRLTIAEVSSPCPTVRSTHGQGWSPSGVHLEVTCPPSLPSTAPRPRPGENPWHLYYGRIQHDSTFTIYQTLTQNQLLRPCFHQLSNGAIRRLINALKAPFPSYRYTSMCAHTHTIYTHHTAHTHTHIHTQPT